MGLLPPASWKPSCRRARERPCYQTRQSGKLGAGQRQLHGVPFNQRVYPGSPKQGKLGEDDPKYAGEEWPLASRRDGVEDSGLSGEELRPARKGFDRENTPPIGRLNRFHDWFAPINLKINRIV